MSAIQDVARRFVEMARSNDEWSQATELDALHEEVIRDTLTAAGFEGLEITPGKIPIYDRDQDGSAVGISHYFNESFPFIASSKKLGNMRPTGWLMTAVYRARQGEFDEKVMWLVAEIEKSLPFKAIRITPDGDLMEECPPTERLGFMPEHTRDETVLGERGTNVGIHAFCNSWIDRRGATAEKDALVCRGCHLRVLFPKSIVTYGQLREELDPSMRQAAAH